ncbi:Os11g0477400, partial [Oryza sativa Japonica Group]
ARNMSTSERSYGSKDGYYSEEEDSFLDMLVAALKAKLCVRAARWVSQQSGMEWVMETMENPSQCQAIFRLMPDQIHALFGLLTNRYNLHGSIEVCPMEALGIFLYIMAGGNSNRATNNRMNDEEFQPFAGAAGAVDGAHIHCIVAVDDSIQHRNRHHITSRNVRRYWIGRPCHFCRCWVARVCA